MIEARVSRIAYPFLYAQFNARFFRNFSQTEPNLFSIAQSKVPFLRREARNVIKTPAERFSTERNKLFEHTRENLKKSRSHLVDLIL